MAVTASKAATAGGSAFGLCAADCRSVPLVGGLRLRPGILRVGGPPESLRSGVGTGKGFVAGLVGSVLARSGDAGLSTGFSAGPFSAFRNAPFGIVRRPGFSLYSCLGDKTEYQR